MIEAFIKGIAISLLLIISVGPVVFTVIKQSINTGRAGGFSIIAGVFLSDLLWITLSNVLSELVQQLLDFKKPIAIIGSSFLMGLGIFYIFFKKIHIKEDENKIVITAGTHARLVFQGFLINTLNPAVMLFWLTTATALAESHSIKQRIVIFATCLTLNTSADIAKVILAGRLRNKLNEKNISLINKISGVILLIFGLVLIIGALYATVKH